MTYQLISENGRVLDEMTDGHGRSLLAFWLKANRRHGKIVKQS